MNVNVGWIINDSVIRRLTPPPGIERRLRQVQVVARDGAEFERPVAVARRTRERRRAAREQHLHRPRAERRRREAHLHQLVWRERVLRAVVHTQQRRARHHSACERDETKKRQFYCRLRQFTVVYGSNDCR